uniref:Synaptobrevin, longin-like domain protein n=1 Tax=Tanacetum cinerariifolium TaxID=118510 RepID=A0A6L2KFS4_TANCI|nr:hypothetical protein [Tanacetum cinerariifolium]
MTLTFVETHNMIAYLIKSNASKGFNQIIDFLNGSSIQYALTVNPNIYVSCIKQFWTSVAMKKVNDVMRLQDLVDKKKVIITEASIRDSLHLDDAEGVEYLPNAEIFIELARIGYEKPSTKLTFYKAFFSSQWKFLIHTILQCTSAKRTSWNEFSSSMASVVICLSTGRKFNFLKYIFDSLVRNVDSPTKFYMYPHFLQLMIRKQVGDLSSHTTKYTSPALTQKVFANMRRVGKGFSGVETSLFEGMIVEHQVNEGAGKGADEVHDEGVHTIGVTAEGVVSAANDEVPTAVEEPSIPSPTPPTPPPQPSQDQPSTSQDKIAQALEITKLKSRVKKLERRNKASKLKRLKKVGIAQRIDTSDDTVMDDVSKQGGIIGNINAGEDVFLEDAKGVAVEKSADVEDNANIQGRKVESQAEICKIDMEHAKKVLSMQEEESEPAELQEVVDVVTTTKIITKVVTAASDTIIAASTTINAAGVPIPTAKIVAASTLTVAPSKRRKGVVIRDPQETAPTSSTIIHSKAKSKDKEAELNKKIDWDEVIDHVQRKQKEDKAVKRFQDLKRKPQTEAQARKNMMIYLRNVVGFKMDYFKGMNYDDIRPIFEKHFNSNMAFLLKTKEQMDEEDRKAHKRLNESQEDKVAKKQKLDDEVEELKRHLQIVPNDEDDVYTEATPLARKVPIVDYEIYNENNKPFYKIKRADGSHQLYLSFLSLLRNFDREDLETLWRLVKERFATTKPKNFFDDFLLITLGAMFEKPDLQAQIWKNQRSVHGQAKVKSWKLLESSGVQIITFTITRLILLVERRYPLTRFTLDQMHNNVRVEVKEESEVSLELLSFGVDAADDFKEKHAKCLILLVKDLLLPSQVDVVD